MCIAAVTKAIIVTFTPENNITGLAYLVLYTGTRLYRNTGLVASISEPVFQLLSIRYSFLRFLSSNANIIGSLTSLISYYSLKRSGNL